MSRLPMMNRFFQNLIKYQFWLGINLDSFNYAFKLFYLNNNFKFWLFFIAKPIETESFTNYQYLNSSQIIMLFERFWILLHFLIFKHTINQWSFNTYVYVFFKSYITNMDDNAKHVSNVLHMIQDVNANVDKNPSSTSKDETLNVSWLMFLM